MRKIYPIVFLMPKNTNDMFVDVEHLQEYLKARSLNKPLKRKSSDEYIWGGLALGCGLAEDLGKNVFVFDVESCDILTAHERLAEAKDEFAKTIMECAGGKLLFWMVDKIARMIYWFEKSVSFIRNKVRRKNGLKKEESLPRQ